MLLGVSALGEEACGFDDDIRANGSPINLGRVLGFENLKTLPLYGDSVLGVRDFVRQIAEDGVVLQKVRESLGVGDVVNGDELNVLVVERGAHDVAADTAEAVDANLDGHYFLRWSVRNCGRSRSASRPRVNRKCYGLRRQKSTRQSAAVIMDRG